MTEAGELSFDDWSDLVEALEARLTAKAKTIQEHLDPGLMRAEIHTCQASMHRLRVLLDSARKSQQVWILPPQKSEDASE